MNALTPMKPMMILPPNLMSKEDIKALRDNGICVVEAQDPAKVRFVDPIPAVSSRTDIENAAIRLSRRILGPGFWSTESTRQLMCMNYIELLAKGTPLDVNGTTEEQQNNHYERIRWDEIERLARADAKAEREAKKKAAEEAAKKGSKEKTE